MTENYLKRIIKKNAQMRLLMYLIFIVITIGIFISNFRLISTLYSPLSSIKSFEDAKTLFDEDKVYAHLENADLYFIDYAIYTSETYNGVKTSDDELSQAFGVIAYDNGYLLALVPKSYIDMDESELQSVFATCKLESLDDGEYYDDAYDELIKELGDSYDDMSNEEIKQYVPKMCVTIPEYDRSVDQLLIAIDILVCMIFIFFLITKIVVISDYKKSKLYKQLIKFGSAEDVEYSIAQSVERENYLFKSDYKPVSRIGLITPEYIIAKRDNGLHIFLTRDLIWAHLKITKHKYRFVTISKSYKVMLFFKGVKKPASITFRSENQANELIARISQNLPVICGYDYNLAHTYKSNYAGFLQMTEQYHNDFYRNRGQDARQTEYSQR